MAVNGLNTVLEVEVRQTTGSDAGDIERFQDCIKT